LEQMPQSAYVHFNLGNVYASHRQWAQAQQAYFNAYRYDNQNADYAYNLAISLDQLNQPSAALTYYQKALQLSQRQPVHFNLPKLRQRIQTLKAHHQASALTELTTFD
ncbi:MAG: tetratricopeptide repeat protein, partial [Pseudomonadota bacterium]|nr:tetratricopeptide repeat protein [Pseudomonadota bacterium]